MFASITARNISLSHNLRQPLIKFRYGAARDQHQKTAGSLRTVNPSSSKPGQAPASGEAIYDFQIPVRWRRRPISEDEIEYINRGGPA